MHPKAPKSKTQNLTNRTLACASFLYSPKMWSKAQNPLRISICQFLSACCIGFQHLRGSKIEKIGKKAKKIKKNKKFCKLTIFSSILPPNCIFSMDDWWHWGSPSIFSFLSFWVKKGKFWNFENFQILLTSAALVPLLCFPKARKMFVCREELQTMILSTEWPLYHVGELKYGPPKFIGVKLKISENAFLSFESSWCVYITKMVLSGTNWSHMENNDHCCHFGGIWKENNLFWA